MQERALSLTAHASSPMNRIISTAVKPPRGLASTPAQRGKQDAFSTSAAGPRGLLLLFSPALSDAGCCLQTPVRGQSVPAAQRSSPVSSAQLPQAAMTVSKPQAVAR